MCVCFAGRQDIQESLKLTADGVQLFLQLDDRILKVLVIAGRSRALDLWLAMQGDWEACRTEMQRAAALA